MMCLWGIHAQALRSSHQSICAVNLNQKLSDCFPFAYLILKLWHVLFYRLISKPVQGT